MRPLLLLVTAGLLVPTLLPGQALDGRADSIYTWRGTLRAQARLSVSNFNGPIDVRPSAGTEVEMRAEKRTGRGGADLRDVGFDVRSAANGDVTICAVLRTVNPCQGDRSRNDDGDWNGRQREIVVAMTLLVPRGADVRIATGNGAVTIERAGGQVQASTGNGAVRVLDTNGPVRVTTGNGDVEVRGATATVRAVTGNGDVTVVTSSGPVDARSGHGDIDVRISALGARDNMTFATGSGSVHLVLPASYNGELDASTGNGELRSDFDLKVKGRLDPRRIRATIGEGGPLLRLSTGNGRLDVLKGQ